MSLIFRYRRWPVALTLAALATLAFILLYPGAGGSAPPPETIGKSQVFNASDLGAGGFSATSLRQSNQPAGSNALALEAATPSGQGRYVSDTIKADFPFSALGLHWLAQNPPGTSVATEVRFSRDGTTWDDWQKVPVDDQELPDHIASTSSAGETIGELVYTDAARYYQYSLKLSGNPQGQSPQITRVTASYIDAKGYSESPLSLAFISRLPGRALAFLTPSRGEATPTIITRAQWGANESWMIWDHEYAPVKKEIIHHTVTSNSDSDPAATVRSIYYYHAVTLGWGDIGYNYLIDQQGRIYEGRSGGSGVIGGHALGWNNGSVGISALGNYDVTDISSATYSAFVELMSSLAVTNNINPNGSDYFVHYVNGVGVGGNPANFLGHRDTYATACPGQYLYNRLPQFRSEAAARFNPYTVNSPFLEKWQALGGAPGVATSNAYNITGGSAQNFTSGRLIYNQATGQVYWIVGAIMAEYDAVGGWNGLLGLPTSDEYGYGVGRVNDFAGGKIYWSSITGAHYVMGGIMQKFLAEGGPDRIGFPTTDESDAPGVSGARESDFQRGRIYWDVDHGSHVIYGGIMDKYLEWGGPATFGIPIADEHDVTGKAGARQSDFAGGWFIYWSATTGAHPLVGEFVTELAEWGGPAGFFGLPTSDAVGVPTGFTQDFEGGIITRDLSSHTYVVYGAIAAKYRQLGAAVGALGVATSDEIDTSGVSGARESDFVNGRVYWSSITGTNAVYGAILTKYLEAGGPGSSLGLPISDEYAYGEGRRSDFTGGFIYWDATLGISVFTQVATSVTSTSSYEVRDGNGALLASLGAGQVATVQYNGSLYNFQGPASGHVGTSYIRMSPSSGGILQVTSYHDHPVWNPSLDDNTFRGAIEVRWSTTSNALWVVNDLLLEQYLVGIAETSQGDPAEYLKTMTSAARSYALWHLGRGGKYGSSEIFQLKNSRNGNGDDQQYRGYGLESRFPDLVAAVSGTAGQAVTYGGSVAMTSYFSNSDGRTRSANEAWGWNMTDWPWLASVPDPDCNGMTLSGHGVGLSGAGARARAGRGDGYAAILTYYYSGTAIQALDTNRNIRVAIQEIT